jgi:hypothetical protein
VSSTPTGPDERDPAPDQLSPGDEAQVRRLLAGARATGPMPADVAARLDATLADLDRERSAHEGVPESERPLVSSLSDHSRRRRRTIAGLALAAASVVVVGIGIGQVVDDTTGEGDTASGTSVDRTVTTPDDPDEAGDEAGGALDSQAEREVPPGSSTVPPSALELRPVDRPAPPVDPDRLARDAGWVRNALLPDDAGRRYDEAVLISPRGFQCAGAPWGTGVFIGVDYDGSPAVLAFRQPTQQHQVVEVLQCGTGEVLRATTLDAPERP